LELKEFISSGVLESYVLGTATAEEISRVREMAKLHPEVNAELEQIEASLMEYAESGTSAPSYTLKNKITSALFEEPASRVRKPTLVNINGSSSSSFMRYAVAASVGLLIGLSVFTYSLYEKLTKAQLVLSVSQQENDILADELNKKERELDAQITELNDKKIELAMMMKPGSKMIMLKGMDLAPEATAMILWNTKDKEVYINNATLPMPPEGKQYQLWAIVNGKPVDAGVFMVSEGKFTMQKMKDMSNAQAFAVTLENAGGSEKPTMEAMYLMGNV
jgi:anti-sigma-K factor RskA